MNFRVVPESAAETGLARRARAIVASGGDLTQALGDAQKAASKGVFVETFKIEGDILVQLGRNAEAIDAYRTALDHVPDINEEKEIEEALQKLGTPATGN